MHQVTLGQLWLRGLTRQRSLHAAASLRVLFLPVYTRLPPWSRMHARSERTGVATVRRRLYRGLDLERLLRYTKPLSSDHLIVLYVRVVLCIEVVPDRE